MAKKFTLYVDESGVANLAEYQSRYFILTAITVEHKPDLELSAYFNYIKKKHGISEDTSLHATEFFENKKSPYFLKNKKAKAFCQSLAEFIKIAPFEINVLTLDKKILRDALGLPKGYKFKGSRDHKEDKEVGYEILGRKLMFDFAKFLSTRKVNGTGFIVAESRRGSDRLLLGTYLDCSQSSIFKGTLKKLSQTLTTRVVSICFENKNSLRGGLQLADLISYLTYKKVNKGLSRIEKRGGDLLWKAVTSKSKITALDKRLLSRFGKDRIDKISKRVQQRLSDFRDLVNPTLR